ncbi:MAG TPA: hypothetical protein VFM55_01770 [Micromonosporaceae bacterium]|nr:hypothetical protein [Micromonosporaceae bacterium]
MAHTIVTCHRLFDVVDLIETDPRVQVVFTVAPSPFNHSVPQYLERRGAHVVPWSQAIREPFDLAVAAAYYGLDHLHAPLVMMAHGAGHGRLVRPTLTRGPILEERPVYGLDAQRLTNDGAVLATALLLSHHGEREVLHRQCPAALEVAVLAGDPCFDRLVASLPWRPQYRQALGVSDDQELVVVSSTWGPDGLFGNSPTLLPWIMDELVDEPFRAAALLHPAVWAAHGIRQVRAWTRDCREAGLLLLDPAQDWRALLVAADHLIGDHGSVTAYGAGIGRPVLHLAPTRSKVMAAGSAQQLVATTAARLEQRQPLIPQLRTAPPIDRDAVVAALTSRPGHAHQLIRRTMYRLLGLDEPGRHRGPTPVPVPRIDCSEVGQ